MRNLIIWNGNLKMKRKTDLVIENVRLKIPKILLMKNLIIWKGSLMKKSGILSSANKMRRKTDLIRENSTIFGCGIILSGALIFVGRCIRRLVVFCWHHSPKSKVTLRLSPPGCWWRSEEGSNSTRWSSMRWAANSSIMSKRSSFLGFRSDRNSSSNCNWRWKCLNYSGNYEF